VEGVSKMIRQRQGDMSAGEFSAMIGLPRTTYVAYIKRKREIGRKGMIALIKHFKKVDDGEMVAALMEYFGA